MSLNLPEKLKIFHVYLLYFSNSRILRWKINLQRPRKVKIYMLIVRMLILNVRSLGLHSSGVDTLRYDAEQRPIYTQACIGIV